MTESEVQRYEREVQEAQTEEELNEVIRRWNPILAKCFRSTSLRVKELNAKMDNLREELVRSTIGITERINELHKKPTFKEAKIEWILANIERILLTLIVLSLIFGRDWVANLISK